jgi:hypothetical protein
LSFPRRLLARRICLSPCRRERAWPKRIVLGARSLDHSRFRLSAFAVQPIGTASLNWMVRTIVYLIDNDLMVGKLGNYPVSEVAKLLLRIKAAANAGLIGDNDDRRGVLLPQLDRFRRFRR